MKTEEKRENVEVKTEETNVPAKSTDTGGMRREQTSFSHPFTLMRHFAEDMENIFDNFGFDRRFPMPSAFFDRDFFGTERTDLSGGFSPPVEMIEREGKLIVRADLPGIEKDDIKVEVLGNSLTIEGERKQESEEEKDGFYRSERSYGSFYRRLPLPENVKTEDAKATFKNGVLEVTLAAPEITTSGKRVEITGEKTETKTAASG